MLSEKKKRVVLHPDDAQARVDLGEALFLEKDYAGAEKQLQRALALDPDHPNVRRLLAAVYKADERPVPAENILTEAVKRKPDDISAREDLASLLVELNRYDQAILHLEEALKVEPSHVERRAKIIDLCITHGIEKRALRHLQEALKMAPDNPEFLKRELDVRLMGGHLAGILRTPLAAGKGALHARIKRALETPPLVNATQQPALKQVVVFLREGDVHQAKKALLLSPAEAKSLPLFDMLRGETALLAGDVATAESAFSKARDKDPTLMLPWARLGELKLWQGHPAEALVFLENAAKGSTPNGEVLEMWGDALYSTGKKREALEKYRQAMAIAPEVMLGAKIGDVERGDREQAGAPAVGRIVGMGWHPTGGVVMPIQAEIVPGKGELHLTGQMVGTARESARLVHTLLKNRAAFYRIEKTVTSHDLHLHYASQGDKTGLSAGLAFAIAALSAYLQKPLPVALAATGAITLDGAVVDVAGLGEKLLAAYLFDVKTVIAPRKNLFAIRDLPSDIQDKLRVHFVDSLGEAVSVVWETA
ncbi:MAG: tetratricopeptide repeat protein [Polyangiaceae bacterium]|nr:tetratricopeptide repeat protein [Polyangiaceae bacterium]